MRCLRPCLESIQPRISVAAGLKASDVHRISALQTPLVSLPVQCTTLMVPISETACKACKLPLASFLEFPYRGTQGT